MVTGAISAYATPDPAVADVARVNPGRTDFSSRLNQVVTVQPGRYDDVRILAGSRLILPGGTYELSTLHLGLGVVVEVRGPVLIRVASTLQLLHGTKVQPAAGLATAQVRWETTDRNVLVGNDVQFFGELAAPEARVDIGREARIRGAIEAERVVVGDCAQVIGPPSGPGSPGGVDRVQRLVAYGVNSLNQYTSVGGVARSHDRSGNLVDDGVRRLTWDYRNRVVAVADKASGRPIAAYAYDCGNRRVQKTTYTAAGGVDRVTRSFWDGWDLVEEQSAIGTTEATYVSGVGIDEHLQVARTSASPLGAGVLWCAQDARGDVVAVTNASGAVVERAKFDDFGRQTGGGAQPHGFQGRYRDAETGWVYFRNRYYDPETGRFLSQDPVWDKANLGNLYTYSGNSGSGADPLGLCGESAWGTEFFDNWLRPLGTGEFWDGFSHDIADTATAGWLSRQEALEYQYGAGLISDAEYAGKSTLNFGASAGMVALNVWTGGQGAVALRGLALTERVVGGAALGSAMGASTFAASKVTEYAVTGEVHASNEEAIGALVLGGAFGGLAGAAVTTGPTSPTLGAVSESPEPYVPRWRFTGSASDEASLQQFVRDTHQIFEPEIVQLPPRGVETIVVRPATAETPAGVVYRQVYAYTRPDGTIRYFGEAELSTAVREAIRVQQLAADGLWRPTTPIPAALRNPESEASLMYKYWRDQEADDLMRRWGFTKY